LPSALAPLLLNLSMPQVERPIIVLGAGGHARVLIDALQQLGTNIMGITDPDKTLWGQTFMDVDILGPDEKIFDIHPERILLVNALGSTQSTKARQKLFETWQQRGYTFATIVHLKSVLASSVTLAEGVQVLAGAVINPYTTVGMNTIVNTGVVLEHDCIIGDHVHLAPGVRVAGNVSIGRGTHVGIGSTVIQGLTLGENCLIAAGAVVIRSVSDYSVVMGVPGKSVRTT
jgi:sugar O-acyltransferase (sialic acid O-acetyltransferase NeuD family)